MKFNEKLLYSIRSSRSILCAGLDPVPEDFPPVIRSSSDEQHNQVVAYCRQIIEQTKNRVAAYKINLAFFEALGISAFHALDEVLDAIPSGKILIADAKRGDIPHTNMRYKMAYFDRLGFDAITLSPFMGMDTLIPFLQDEERAAYILTLTSNSGASDLMTRPFSGKPTLSLYLAELLKDTTQPYPGAAGMVIGATQSLLYGPVLKAWPESLLLIPGVGAQGGSLSELQNHLADHRGLPLVNVSRGLSAFDPENPEPWDIQIAHNVIRYNESMNKIIEPYLNRS